MTSVHLDGDYFDGEMSQTFAAHVDCSEHELTLRVPELSLIKSIELNKVRVQAQIGDVPRRITWGERDCLTSTVHASLDWIATRTPLSEQVLWISWLEQRAWVAGLGLALAVVLLGAVMIWAVPYAAQKIAYAAPPQVGEQLARGNLEAIDLVLGPSVLDEVKQAELASYFVAHSEPDLIDLRVEFRDGKQIGANAFAIGGHTVVFTDQLIDLTDDWEELLAVYLHETGHSRLKHVERSILQNSSWVVLLSVIIGDYSGASELVVSLPIALGENAYSRDFEREADVYAIEQLEQVGISPLKLASVLDKIGHAHKNELPTDSESVEATQEQSWASGVLEYLSTHPAPVERAKFIRDRSTGK